MVKVVERTDKEIAEIERTNRLEKITKEILGKNFNVSKCINNIFLTSKKPIMDFLGFNKAEISVYSYPNRNQISVDDPKYLQDAITLAKAYETNGESEFTVKKNY